MSSCREAAREKMKWRNTITAHDKHGRCAIAWQGETVAKRSDEVELGVGRERGELFGSAAHALVNNGERFAFCVVDAERSAQRARFEAGNPRVDELAGSRLLCDARSVERQKDVSACERLLRGERRGFVEEVGMLHEGKVV